MRRWLVLLGCFVGMAVTMSSLFIFPLGVYMKAITAEFGWSRTQFSATLSFVAISNGLVLPMAGWAVDRFGAMSCIVLGLIVGCCSCAALALVHSYPAFIAISCFASIAGCLALYPAYFKIVRGWFDKNLALALAIASAGVSLGVAVFSFLIKTTLDASGWRRAFVTTSTVALIIGLANLMLFIRENRSSVPLAERRRNEVETASAGQSLGEAVHTIDFWLFSIAFALVVFVGAGPNLHLPAMIADRGGSPGAIASAMAAIPLGSVCGRLVSGFLLDRILVRVVAALFFLTQACGILMLWRESHWVAVAAFCMGTAQGAELDMMGFVMARRFGRRAYARIFGSAFAISQLGLIASPIIIAVIFDATHSYNLALATYPILSVVAILLIWRANASPAVRTLLPIEEPTPTGQVIREP